VGKTGNDAIVMRTYPSITAKKKMICIVTIFVPSGGDGSNTPRRFRREPRWLAC
jgi:hypothetical protein